MNDSEHIQSANVDEHKYNEIIKKTTKGLWLMQYKDHGYITNAGVIRRFFYRLRGAKLTYLENLILEGEELDNVDYIECD